jgi:hypothetical protein
VSTEIKKEIGLEIAHGNQGTNCALTNQDRLSPFRLFLNCQRRC